MDACSACSGSFRNYKSIEARNTNSQAHCLALPSAPLSTLVTGRIKGFSSLEKAKKPLTLWIKEKIPKY